VLVSDIVSPVLLSFELNDVPARLAYGRAADLLATDID
jgi:hypothetical protein